MSINTDSLPTWEVFMQQKNGAAHEHVGSVHAADAELALQGARDVYARRGGNGCIWVVPMETIYSSSSDDSESFFEPGNDKIYRHGHYYKVPRTLKNI